MSTRRGASVVALVAAPLPARRGLGPLIQTHKDELAAVFSRYSSSPVLTYYPVVFKGGWTHYDLTAVRSTL